MNFTTETTQGLRTAHVTWHQQLESCEDVDQILTLTREFLATFGPEHLARLPDGCRPGRIKGEDDIAYWSCKLAQCHHADSAMRVDADLLQELLNYFLHAWVRLSQLQRVSLPAANAKLH
jgi:hypothetical protein